MGLTSSAFADPHARLTPELAPETEKLERGHGRGSTYVDRSRTDSLELRGFPCVGYGVAGVITGTRPGGQRGHPRAHERALAMRAARGRFKRPG